MIVKLRKVNLKYHAHKYTRVHEIPTSMQSAVRLSISEIFGSFLRSVHREAAAAAVTESASKSIPVQVLSYHGIRRGEKQVCAGGGRSNGYMGVHMLRTFILLKKIL